MAVLFLYIQEECCSCAYSCISLALVTPQCFSILLNFLFSFLLCLFLSENVIEFAMVVCPSSLTLIHFCHRTCKQSAIIVSIVVVGWRYVLYNHLSRDIITSILSDESIL